ncbi:MAG: Rpn family recombination-promoting nuclease/putative transposase [Magnetococcales bacterium]|nr:Rpn family recombination-promoting nuclease/putative transposase [Magnetococcales bacterium]
MKFIDPRIDFAFKKIFGSEDAKDIPISFLESLMGLEGERSIAELTILDPFPAPRLKELKSSLLDVRCKDQRGASFIVEMHIEKVEVDGFLKRIQYNSAKSKHYSSLDQVIVVTITDFVLFPDFDHCVSCHKSYETITGYAYFDDVVYYFIELPKFAKTLDQCAGILEKWIYFIRHAESLDCVPEQLDLAPFRHAFEKAMMANMTRDELELYDKAGMAITDARGQVEPTWKEG